MSKKSAADSRNQSKAASSTKNSTAKAKRRPKTVADDDQDIPPSTGGQLLKARKYLQLSKVDVARALGIAPQTLYKMERHGFGSKEVFEAYVRYLYEKGNINPAWILLYDSPKKINFKVQTLLEVVEEANIQFNILKHTTIDAQALASVVPEGPEARPR